MSRPRDCLRTLAWALLVALPVVAALLRLAGHPGAFQDGEASIPATIGRELHLCGPHLVFHYQVIAYQGSLVLDSLLSAAGYAAFGDHLLAWHWVPLLWLLLASAAGTAVLHLAAGPAGAAAWPMLLAAAPFVVKDGVVSGIGGHAAGPGWGLLALALALRAGPGGRRAWLWGLLSGLALSLGAWHIRSAALAAPALVLACSRGGRPALLGMVAGLLGFPALVSANVAALEAGTFRAGAHPWGLTLQILDPGPQAGPQRPLVEKLGQATGWLLAPTLFMQPADWRGAAPGRPLAGAAGWVFVVSWLLALPALALAGLARRGDVVAPAERVPATGGRPLAAVLALAMAWPIAYVVLHLAAEESIRVLARDIQPGSPAPTISATRYLVPQYLCWLLLLSAAVGACQAGRRLRLLAALLLGLPLVAGAWHAAGDWLHDRDDARLFSTLDPFFYPGIALPGRTPPPEVHLGCLPGDPSSRAFHLQALARVATPGMGPAHADPGLGARALEETLARIPGGLAPVEQERLAGAFGAALGEQARGGVPGGVEEAALTALRASAFLEEPLASAWLAGFAGALPVPREGRSPDVMADLCGRVRPEARPEGCP